MKESRIDSIPDLIEVFNTLPNHFVFRGHASSAWHLESTLERVLGNILSDESAKRFEEFALLRFKSKFHLYDRENIKPETKLAWLSIMQHYGVPTRLLDFTESPYVALYFALEGYNPQSRDDFAIFSLDYKAIMTNSKTYISSQDGDFKDQFKDSYDQQDIMFERFVDKRAYDVVWIAEPSLLNVRLDRQAGSFLFACNRSRRIEDILELPIYCNVQMNKYIIANDLYEGLFVLLRKMNLTSKSLYGNLDGLAKSISMEMKVYAFEMSGKGDGGN